MGPETPAPQQNRANIITMLPDGRFVVGIALPILDRADAEFVHRQLGQALAKIPVATTMPPSKTLA